MIANLLSSINAWIIQFFKDWSTIWNDSPAHKRNAIRKSLVAMVVLTLFLFFFIGVLSKISVTGDPSGDIAKLLFSADTLVVKTIQTNNFDSLQMNKIKALLDSAAADARFGKRAEIENLADSVVLLKTEMPRYQDSSSALIIDTVKTLEKWTDIHSSLMALYDDWQVKFVNWYLIEYVYCDLIGNIANADNPAKFLLARENSPIIYISIFLLRLWFDRLVFKRMLWIAGEEKVQRDCLQLAFVNDQNPYAEFQAEIGKTLQDKLELSAEFLRLSFAPKQPAGEKHLEAQYVRILDDDAEHQEIYLTQLIGARNWIIRLGILGTLMGLMMAFYEVSESIRYSGISAQDTFSAIFRTKIRGAVSGNAIAVVTSVAAHITTFLVELFIAAPLRFLSARPELQKLRDKLAERPDFADPIASARQTVSAEVKSFLKELGLFQQAVAFTSMFWIREVENQRQSFIEHVKDIKESIQKASIEITADTAWALRDLTGFVESLRKITKSLSIDLSDQGLLAEEQYKEHLEKLSYYFNNITESLNEFANRINRAKNELKN